MKAVALYNTYREFWELARHLREIIERREFERLPKERATIS
jgi:TRAP-type mannitol/chloroaromatic compound transport system substrate-binding protein